MNRTKKMGYSSEELLNLYNDTSSGHFFDKDTMRFFRSRLSGEFKRVDDTKAYFITTELGPVDGSKRKATIRCATIVNFEREDGDLLSKIEIHTVGEFNSMGLAKAKTILKGLE